MTVLMEDITQLEALKDYSNDLDNWKEYIREENKKVLYYIDPET